MKRIFILFIVVGLIGITCSVSADIFMKGPIWYNETCNPYSYGNIKQISVSGNYAGVAAECDCNVDRAEACNGVFIFDIDPANISGAAKPFVYSTNGWVESVHIDGNKAVAGSSDSNLYYFEVNEYKNWQKKFIKNLGSTVDSVYVSGNYIAGGSGNYVYLFDTNGNEKWKYDVNSKTNVITIIDDKVIAGTRNDYVYIFDISGNIIKNIKTNAPIDSIYAADGIIAVGSDQIYVFDSNGVEKWKSGTKGNIKSVHFADGTLVAGSLNNIVYTFDMDGELKAKYLTNSSVWSVHVNGDYVAVSSTDGIVYLIDTNGELKWKYKVGISATARSQGVSSIYNTENYVYVGGWGKSIYLFNSLRVIADDEIKKADRLIMYVKGEMDTTKEEAIVQEAQNELESGNYDRTMELAKSVKPTIINRIENMISEMENNLNKINETIETEKYTGLSTEINKEYDGIETARELIPKGRYVEAIRLVKNPGARIKTEVGKIIKNYEETIDKASVWNPRKIESLLAQESEYTAMSKEETEAEIKLAGDISADFSESENNIEMANDALEEGDYETAIKLSEEAIELIEIKINKDIDDAEEEINKIKEMQLLFKIDTSFAKAELDTARERLKHEKCGATYEPDCPDYSASLFWIGHALGNADRYKTIGIAKNIIIIGLVIVSIFIAVLWFRKKKKEETEETAEEEKKEDAGKD